MSSITKKTKQGVQPLAADDGILADSTSDGESPGVSEGDGPLRQADEAELYTTISGDGPEILRVTYIADLLQAQQLQWQACLQHARPKLSVA